MFKCTNPTTAVRLSMIPTIFVAVFAANQSGQSRPAKPALQAQTSVQVLYQQPAEKLAAGQLDINTQARHVIMLDDPAWLIQKIRSFLQEAK